ncbi:hypothetical protein E2C01_020540 [Portunus trituberculatus]|uniref:Uncharacterized protein n=1 Tax=Portunus trituberculatus TaxID=210409 RepID=A0A5B7E0E1_PORTR|nr:hypothetical protein [Portunus trituberculatus]
MGCVREGAIGGTFPVFASPRSSSSSVPWESDLVVVACVRTPRSSHRARPAVVTDGEGAKKLYGHDGRLTLRREGFHQVFREGEANNGQHGGFEDDDGHPSKEEGWQVSKRRQEVGVLRS